MSGFEHALVIGASSGMGERLAHRLASGGARVALVARREDRLKAVVEAVNDAAGEERGRAWVHDVRDVQEVPAMLQEICRWLGGLDLAVYAAGLQRPVGFDEFDVSKDREMLEVNIGGAVAWLNPIAERFGRLRQGTIVGIGSVAGDRGRSGSPGYNTSKAAVHTYLEALRNRIGRYGVNVVTIKPGFVDTAMTRGMSGLFWLISADRAAEIILRKAERGVVTAYVPARWRVLMWVIRAIPSIVFKRLKV